MRFFLFIFLCISFSFQGQTISGTIKDASGNAIDFANVLIKESSNPSSTIEFTRARNGLFAIVLQKEYAKILVEIVSVGYETQNYTFENTKKDSQHSIDCILQNTKITELKEVLVVSDKPFSVKKDTVTYNIEKYKDGTERKVEDILKKLPGIEVNEKSGKIKYKGKPIEAVTLDGDNLFGGNYTLGTKNINVDIVEQVQAIENYSENPLLAGIESGGKVSINLKLKKGMVDYSGNVDIGFGINDNSNVLNNSNANILGISKRHKSFATLTYNNIGINHTPFNYFSNNENFKSNDNNIKAPKVISESLFSNILDDERVNNNSLFFSSYNSVFKINKKMSLTSSIYYLRDDIKFDQFQTNENNFENSIFITSDNFATKKKPQFYSGDFIFKFNVSKNSLLEYKANYNYEKINTFSSIFANNQNGFQTNLISKDIILNQKITYTNKISNSKAIQINLVHVFNDAPQSLILTQINSTSFENQDSNFRKIYFDCNFNLLGRQNDFKYSVMFGGRKDDTPFVSFNNQNQNLSENNSILYSKKAIYNSSSLNYTIQKWIFGTSYSLNFLNQNLYNNFDNTSDYRKNIVQNATLSIKYNFNIKSSLVSKFSYSENPFSEENIYRNPVLINNRLRTSNLPSLEIQKSKLVAINYILSDLYNQFSLGLGTNYKVNNGAFFQNLDISQNQTIINNFYSNEKNDNLNFNFNIKKFISSLSINMAFTSNYAKSNYKNIVNLSQVRANSSDNFTNEFSIKTALDIKFNFENNITFNYFSNKSPGFEAIINKSFLNDFIIKYKHSKSIFANVTCSYILPNSNNKKNHFFFMDFSFTYKPEYKKYEFILIGKNLLNSRFFSQIQTSDFSKNTLQTNLLSRYVFLNFTYKI